MPSVDVPLVTSPLPLPSLIVDPSYLAITHSEGQGAMADELSDGIVPPAVHAIGPAAMSLPHAEERMIHGACCR